MMADNFLDDRQHTFHPGRVPRRRLGEETLHVDAEMDRVPRQRAEAQPAFLAGGQMIGFPPVTPIIVPET